MFTVLTSNTGRTVYLGRVASKDGHGAIISGEDWDAKNKVAVKKEIRFAPDADVKDINYDIGDIILVSVLPAKNDPSQGTAEMITKAGELMSVTNQNGKMLKLLVAPVKGKRWNEKHNKLQVSFTQVREDGKLLGVESRFSGEDGEEHSCYWTNINFFNSEQHNINTADRLDKNVEKGNLLFVQCTESAYTYNQKEYVCLNGQKFFKIADPSEQKNAGKSAGQSSGQQSVAQPADAPITQQDPSSDFTILDDLDELPFN